MEFQIKNLDCAYCANLIANKLNKDAKIDHAIIDFNSQRLIIDGAVDQAYVEKIISSIEDGVILVPRRATEQVEFKINIKDKIRSLGPLFSGIIIFGLSYIGIFSTFKFIMLISAYLLCGYDIFIKVIKSLLKGQFFDENFLMGIATIAAFAIGQYQEAIAILIFYKIGLFFQDIAVNKSRQNISELMDLKMEYANLIQGAKIVKVDPKSIKVNDIILVKVGEKIPLDGIIIEGSSTLDNKALTGETKLVTVKPGCEVLSGGINQEAIIKIRVKKEYKDSTVAKILELVENSSLYKSKTENFITKFARYYTPTIVFLALFIAVVFPLIFSTGFYPWIYRALVFLVLSCPCALVLSIPLSFFGGIGSASKQGILIKGANYLEALNTIEMVVFDKTGTITKGNFQVSKIGAQTDADELIKYACIGEHLSNHPIAQAINSYRDVAVDSSKISNYQEISGYGTSLDYENDHILLGNYQLLKNNNIAVKELCSSSTIVYVAVNNKYFGYLEISDEIKASSRSGIKELREQGIDHIMMLSGDNADVVKEVAHKVGIKEYLSKLLPQDKVKKILTLKEKYHCLFVGDGLNDAPVLAVADVGVAMGGIGSAAAIEAADVVIMNDDITKVAQSLKIAKRTRVIVMENIVLALAVKFFVLVLGVLGSATIWEAVIADVGVTLIAILNAMRILKYKG